MKRIVALVMSFALILALTGCEQKEGKYDGTWAINQIASTINKSIKKVQ